MKKTLYIFVGSCWMLFALGFGLLLLEYLFQGAGIRIFGIALSSVSVLIGLVHVLGLAFATLFSLALGIWLIACGLTCERSPSSGGAA